MSERLCSEQEPALGVVITRTRDLANATARGRLNGMDETVYASCFSVLYHTRNKKPSSALRRLGAFVYCCHDVDRSTAFILPSVTPSGRARSGDFPVLLREMCVS